MSNNSLLQTITNMIDIIANKGTGCDNLINVLSLLCIHNILSRTQPATANTLPQSSTATDTTTNPLNKILGELTKNTDKGGGGGPSPDMLMSLLPLLNNPQIKSKLNPTNISAILGLLNNFGGGNNDKSENSKTEKPDKKEPPAAAITSSIANQPTHTTTIDPYEQDTKDIGNSLNWKTNFQNEKEV